MESSSPHIAILASGTGSNALKIISHFNHKKIKVNFSILSNRKEAPVLEKAKELGIPYMSFNKQTFIEENVVLDYLKERNIKLIVLAGFLWLLPKKYVDTFPKKIINIHPSLLPKYGGKGMYGIKVHEAVVRAKDNISGITIHYVDEAYDHGQHILQKTCVIHPKDSPEVVAKKVQILEHKYFPQVVESLFLRESHNQTET
ncbi:MAG: phosphoribosylglycinamide formyltransferase [Bacteroidota bacterium]